MFFFKIAPPPFLTKISDQCFFFLDKTPQLETTYYILIVISVGDLQTNFFTKVLLGSFFSPPFFFEPI